MYVGMYGREEEKREEKKKKKKRGGGGDRLKIMQSARRSGPSYCVVFDNFPGSWIFATTR